MKLSDYFTKSNEYRANTLMQQHEHYLNLAKIERDEGNFDKSLLYSNHATAITMELKRMHKQKLSTDEAIKLLEQNKQGLCSGLFNERWR
ncbi:hypothetical protein Pryu01_01257 [Paraliobacillus ryukyuensis]|uniref:Uncharacterized protein n=1 Tax=Paraliobacillus ryukyuensis TaxID=200904 RepID=A0A366ECN8_9BACI|nr:hypothetical protein [Paraliobacillus ryukyuensis]RBO99509.1 hypothetical protein DES48_104185 [Paraliobacillus ryukyuensis]